ncbi:NVEALA domain-containing protein [uncultured Bacteroides sp.]|uniref:NVEALA domain-containing protein n=1 Tax=uncultured Bacteroides sp. TaxID=162156 RepID=UPI0025D847B0|nr:NVEALA domain-containing protein [uncultured Bacteroides sp.]
MKTKIMGCIAVVAIAAVAGYNVYTSQNDVKLSNLVIVNMEALAQGESSGGNCEPSDSRECCVCNGIHYTYQASVNSSCETRGTCNHWRE